MKIVFIGCVESSHIFLEYLISDKADIVCVITKKTAGFNSDYCDLSDICNDNNIPIYYTHNVNSIDTKVTISTYAPDLLLCLGWSQLLDEEILNIPSIGSIGFHPAELPFNRGRHPIIWALALGLKSTASTFFLMDSGADTGLILSQVAIDIDYKDDAASLYRKIMNKAVNQLKDVLANIEKGNMEVIPQDYNTGNVWRKRGKADGLIDWRMSSRSIYNLVRALAKPYVGAHFVYKDKEYKVWKVREVEVNCNNYEPGKVLSIDSNTIRIKTGEGAIELIDYDEIDIKQGEYL